MTTQNPFKYFKTLPQNHSLGGYVLRALPAEFSQVEDILHERGIDICHETIRFWVDQFGAKFAKEILKKRVGQHSNRQWYSDEVFVKINAVSGTKNFL